MAAVAASLKILLDVVAERLRNDVIDLTADIVSEAQSEDIRLQFTDQRGAEFLAMRFEVDEYVLADNAERIAVKDQKAELFPGAAIAAAVSRSSP